MKQLLAFLLLIPFLGLSQHSFSQQTAENAFVKARWVTGAAGVNQVLVVSNKQACQTTFTVSQASYSQTYTIAAGDSSRITFNYPFVAGQGVNVTPNLLCGTSVIPAGVTVYGDVSLLPIKFESFTTRYMGDGLVEVVFKVGAAENVSHFNIQLSKDGRTFQTYKVVFADPLQPNKTYTTQIHL